MVRVQALGHVPGDASAKSVLLSAQQKCSEEDIETGTQDITMVITLNDGRNSREALRGQTTCSRPHSKAALQTPSS